MRNEGRTKSPATRHRQSSPGRGCGRPWKRALTAVQPVDSPGVRRDFAGSQRRLPTATPSGRRLILRPSPSGSGSMKSETTIGEDAGELSDGELKAARRLPRLARRAMAPWSIVLKWRLRQRSNPPDWQHSAAGAGAAPVSRRSDVRPAPARRTACARALPRMTRSRPGDARGHGFHPGLPLVDEALRATPIFVTVRLTSAPLPTYGCRGPAGRRSRPPCR